MQFNAQSGWVDCLEFEQTLSGDLSTRPLQTLLAALDLYRGEFLDTLTLSDAPEFELWLLSQRTYLRRLYERGLTQAVTGLMRLNQYEAALQRAQQAPTKQPPARRNPCSPDLAACPNRAARGSPGSV
ncbi:MAG: bacterial transcriptional activator domain-containing protein [Anaerolineae bacterium]